MTIRPLAKGATGSRDVHTTCIAEQVLKGSPFALGISPAPADPAKCVASLESAVGSGRRMEAGKELVVTVQLRDRFGNVTQQAGALTSAVCKICT